MKPNILIAAGLALVACSSDKPTDYTVVLAPAAATVTTGKTLQLGAASKGDIKWTVQEAAGGSVTSTGTYTAPATPGTFHVIATSAKDPKKAATATVTVVPAPQKPVVTSPRLLTAGKSGTASAAVQDGMTFKWAIFGGTISGADTGASISFTSAEPGEVVLGATASNAAGDSSPEAVAVVSVIEPAATPVISAPKVLTAARSGMTASVPGHAGITWKWTAGNGAITSSDTASSITFTAGSAGTLALSVVATNAAGDSAPAANASVEVRPVALEFVAGGLGGPGNLDGVGSAARFEQPTGIAADSLGNAWVADESSHTIRRIAADGTVTTVAGKAGVADWVDAVGTDARLNSPAGVALAGGNVYVAELGNLRIRKISPAGAVSTVAGDGTNPAVDVDGDGLGATFSSPFSIAAAVDGGELWVFDTGTNALRKLTPNPDGGPTWMVNTQTNVSLCCGPGLALDPGGSVYVAQGSAYDVEVVDGGFIRNTIAGLKGTKGYLDGTRLNARFGQLGGIAFDPSSRSIFVGDMDNDVIRRLDYDGSFDEWNVGLAAGGPQDAGSNDGTLDVARMGAVPGIAALGDGGLVFSDRDNFTVRRYADGVITTLAGKATPLAVRVEGPGASARFEDPRSVAVGPDNSTYVADAEYIRRVSPEGVVSTWAGSGSITVLRDGLAGSASFAMPRALAYDKGNRILYLADQINYFRRPSLIRAISYEPAFGAEVVTTVAGDKDNQFRGCAGRDSADALDAGFCGVDALAIDSRGRVFFGENTFPARIRMLERYPDGGGFSVVSVAQGANCGAAPTTGAPLAAGLPSASFCNIPGMAVDSKDRLFFSDSLRQMIRELEFDGGVWVIHDIAGSGTGGCASGDSEEFDAGFCGIGAISFDSHDNLWVADRNNHAVRKLTFSAATQKWSAKTVAGKPGSRGVRPGPLSSASLNGPGGLSTTPYGDVVVLDRTESGLLLLRPDETAPAAATLVQGR